MKSNPVHVKANPETLFMLNKFTETLYHARSRSSFSFSIIKISRYVKNIQNKLPLASLLNTFLSVIMESKHIQSDLKSITFTVLFLYGHSEKKLIENINFIVKDMILKVILLVNLYKIIEEDVDLCLLKKQKLYENIEQEIMKSFVMAFYNRDLKRAMNKIEAVKNDILHSELGLKVDFSFVILFKTFKLVHCLKTILNGHNYESCEPLEEEARLSCRKIFKLKESLFEIIKKVL
ncbi:hypothetical protein NBO_6g0073 [Nosema bombycis CQ1]|uniref:Uncharacterized protein n=1 Tax=Nosema bombycis (strain CQ1 / CVCC 102059) TaxID=578461 RepID=R0KYP1_NOSB1|nr:hypothetical protein NBO_6g0073 [Nosema bombycis CQ1]|eukprot:EOB15322.1 hypothetical protein NBO_6g0073 [Nosema bombycis CQ1]